jgi:hypothetical protein
MGTATSWDLTRVVRALCLDDSFGTTVAGVVEA